MGAWEHQQNSLRHDQKVFDVLLLHSRYQIYNTNQSTWRSIIPAGFPFTSRPERQPSRLTYLSRAKHQQIILIISLPPDIQLNTTKRMVSGAWRWYWLLTQQFRGQAWIWTSTAQNKNRDTRRTLRFTIHLRASRCADVHWLTSLGYYLPNINIDKKA